MNLESYSDSPLVRAKDVISRGFEEQVRKSQCYGSVRDQLGHAKSFAFYLESD